MSARPCEIHLAGVDDLAEMVELWSRAQAARAGANRRVETGVILALMRKRFAQRDAWFAIGRSSDRLVSIGHGVRAREDDGRGVPIPELMHLSLIAVEPGLWGRGFGRAMTEFGIARSFDLGYAAVQLWVHVSNERAKRLYRRLGFVASGRRKRDDGGELIEHCMLRREATA